MAFPKSVTGKKNTRSEIIDPAHSETMGSFLPFQGRGIDRPINKGERCAKRIVDPWTISKSFLVDLEKARFRCGFSSVIFLVLILPPLGRANSRKRT
jgi:hypothetical protein